MLSLAFRKTEVVGVDEPDLKPARAVHVGRNEGMQTAPEKLPLAGVRVKPTTPRALEPYASALDRSAPLPSPGRPPTCTSPELHVAPSRSFLSSGSTASRCLAHPPRLQRVGEASPPGHAENPLTCLTPADSLSRGCQLDSTDREFQGTLWILDPFGPQKVTLRTSGLSKSGRLDLPRELLSKERILRPPYPHLHPF